MTFGEKLRAARQRAGLTQRELAARVDARNNSVCNWEKGRNKPDADTIGALARALNVRADYFFDGEPTEELSELEFALHGALRALDEADKQDVLDFIRYKNAMREKRDRP